MQFIFCQHFPLTGRLAAVHLVQDTATTILDFDANLGKSRLLMEALQTMGEVLVVCICFLFKQSFDIRLK